jgi:hypothetical protein
MKPDRDRLVEYTLVAILIVLVMALGYPSKLLR